MHYFSVAWLEEVAGKLQQGAAYHVARKAIPSKDGPVRGVKLELFIFDTFPMASKVALLEVSCTQVWRAGLGLWWRFIVASCWAPLPVHVPAGLWVKVEAGRSCSHTHSRTWLPGWLVPHVEASWREQVRSCLPRMRRKTLC
jgi:hypothetical protein